MPFQGGGGHLQRCQKQQEKFIDADSSHYRRCLGIWAADNTKLVLNVLFFVRLLREPQAEYQEMKDYLGQLQQRAQRFPDNPTA